MQGATTSGTQAYYKTEAATKKSTADTSIGAVKTQIPLKSQAQVNVWMAEWIQAALETRLRALGDTT